MRYAGLRNNLLSARDRRQRLLDLALAGASGALLTLALNIPGEDKDPPGATGLFAWAEDRLAQALPGLRQVHHGSDALGPFAILAAQGDAQTAKRLAMAIETSIPAGRLIDIDVYRPDGNPADRAAIDHPQRPCLVCDRPARECIRAGRHQAMEIIRRVHELIAPFAG